MLGRGEVNNRGTKRCIGLGETLMRGFYKLGTINIANGNFTVEHGRQNSASSLITVTAAAR